MKSLGQPWLSACSVLVLTACASESEGSASSSLRLGSDPGSAVGTAAGEAVESSDDGFVGAAGAPAEEPASARTPGTVYGVDDSPLTGRLHRAAGSTTSGTVELYCCRAGSYDVYSYEDASCDDPEAWLVERSARLAVVSCQGDSGRAPYVRDPSEATALAVVIYDADGEAVGCADVAD